jgi:hypothetical protein|tara:strand:- start:1822 stop:2943 length:1122 start_codon:yes stop_codon:yes gene_type:complete
MEKTMKTKNKPYNRQIEINKYLAKFTKPFEMKDDAIDTRTMADNYDRGIIPLQDIADAIDIVLGPDKKPNNPDPFDPKTGIVKFDYIAWKNMYLWPRFQRDVAPNHLYKIEQDFEHTSVLLPTAILVDGKYMLWDGHHTAQEMFRQNYTSFPMWFIDVALIPDQAVADAGFTDRKEYAVWLAGQNMIRINSKNKRKLHAYDEFMILLETKDTLAVAMNNILTGAGFVPKRNANTPNAFSQIKSGQSIFEMKDDYNIPGKYLKRALQFHKMHWTKAAAELEVWRPMALLYKMAEVQSFTLDEQFDKELGELFIKKWGDPTSVQLGLKENYEKALHTKGFTQPREHDQWRVYDAIVNLYNSNNGRIQLPQAQCRW